MLVRQFGGVDADFLDFTSEYCCRVLIFSVREGDSSRAMPCRKQAQQGERKRHKGHVT